MRALSSKEMLAIWERGAGRSFQERALTILSVGCSEISAEALAELSIGERDRLLFRLRARTFGPEFSGLVTCLSCREQIEINFLETDICSRDQGESNEPVTLRIDEHAITFRMPTTADLLDIESVQDTELARRHHISRCITHVQVHGNEVSVEALPEGLLQSLSTQIGERDALSDVRLQVCCAACHKQQQVLFDIVRFFWAEIAAQARRLLSEVHLLACVYAWSEEDILSMSAARRGVYLEMVS
jgi:hypothetical protein